MPYRNRIEIAGHLGRDAEYRQAGQKQVAEFSVAVSRGKDKGTDWFRVTLWEPYENQKAALVKGAGVAIVGRMQCDTYEAKDGTKRESWKVQSNAYDLMLLAPTKRDVTENLAERLGRPVPSDPDPVDKSLPF